MYLESNHFLLHSLLLLWAIIFHLDNKLEYLEEYCLASTFSLPINSPQLNLFSTYQSGPFKVRWILHSSLLKPLIAFHHTHSKNHIPLICLQQPLQSALKLPDRPHLYHSLCLSLPLSTGLLALSRIPPSLLLISGLCHICPIASNAFIDAMWLKADSLTSFMPLLKCQYLI